MFRRIGLNEALLSYRRIREGSLFAEMISDEFTVVNQKLDNRNLVLDTLKSLSDKIDSELPKVSEPLDSIRSKLTAIDPFLTSYQIAVKDIERLGIEISSDGLELGKKATKLLGASGDEHSYKLMWAILERKEGHFQAGLANLIQQENRINERKAVLDRLLGTNES